MKRIVMAVFAAVLGVSLAAGAAEVDRREQRQQERIAQGVQSGQLTPRETARLERKEARIDREIKRDRAANGGTVTPAEWEAYKQSRFEFAPYEQGRDLFFEDEADRIRD